MNVKKLRELIEGVPDEVTIEVRNWYDDIANWDGSIESAEYDGHAKKLFLDTKEPD